MDRKTLASYIDHTCLKQNMTILDLEKLIGESIENNFFSICIPPMYVSSAREKLRNTPVKTITVVAFPLGYTNLKSKAVETYQCLADCRRC